MLFVLNVLSDWLKLAIMKTFLYLVYRGFVY